MIEKLYMFTRMATVFPLDRTVTIVVKSFKLELQRHIAHIYISDVHHTMFICPVLLFRYIQTLTPQMLKCHSIIILHNFLYDLINGYIHSNNVILDADGYPVSNILSTLFQQQVLVLVKTSKLFTSYIIERHKQYIRVTVSIYTTDKSVDSTVYYYYGVGYLFRQLLKTIRDSTLISGDIERFHHYLSAVVV